MSQPDLANALRVIKKEFIAGLKRDGYLDSFETSVRFDPATIRGIISTEYRIKDPRLLDEMTNFVTRFARQDPRLKKALRHGKTGSPVWTTKGGATVKSGKVSQAKDRFEIFRGWKRDMSDAFHRKYKEEIGTARDSPTRRGEINKKTNRPYKSGRILSQAMHTEHGVEDEGTYARAQYPVLEALFAGMGTTGWDKGAGAHAWGILYNLKSIDAATIKATIRKEVNATTGKLDDTFTVFASLGGREQNLLRAALERKEFGVKGKFVQLLEEIAVEYDNASPSTMKNLDQALTAMILEKGKKVYKSSAKANTEYKNPKKDTQTAKPRARKPLRTSGGQFTSTMNIQAILDNRIKEEVADNMGKGGALVYRTGRFAESVSVTKVMQSRQGMLTAFYTYMKAPYQTFERGYAQGSLRRDPRKLIAASIREIARETLNHKLQIRTRRV